MNRPDRSNGRSIDLALEWSRSSLRGHARLLAAGSGPPPATRLDLRRVDAARRAHRGLARRGRCGMCCCRCSLAPATRTRSCCSRTCSATVPWRSGRRSVTRSVDEANLAAVGLTPRTRRSASPRVRDELRRGPRSPRSGSRAHHLTARRTEPDRGLARRGRPVRPAQPREVRPRLASSGCPRSRSAVPAHIWATDRSIGYDAKHRLGRVDYASTSRRLVDDLARLLLRYNVFTRLETAPQAGYRDELAPPCSTASRTSSRFRDEIGVHGARGEQASVLAASLGTSAQHQPRHDPGPGLGPSSSEILQRAEDHPPRVRSAMGTQFGGSTMWKHSPEPAAPGQGGRRARRRRPRGPGHQRRLLGRDRRRSSRSASSRCSTPPCWAPTTSSPTGSHCTTLSSRTRTW